MSDSRQGCETTPDDKNHEEPSSRFDRERLDDDRLDAGIEVAFRDFFGVDLFTIDLHEAAKRIQESGCVSEVARALDVWAMVRQYLGLEVARFLALAASVDQDPFLRSVRAWILLGIQPNIEQEFEAALKRGVSEHHLFVLGYLLNRRGDLVRAETIFRRALDLYPERYWPYASLAGVLRAQQPPRIDESLKYLVAGAARIPRSVLGWHRLTQIFYLEEEHVNALDAAVRDAELRPGHGDPYRHVWSILTEHPARTIPASCRYGTIGSYSRSSTSAGVHATCSRCCRPASSRLPRPERIGRRGGLRATSTRFAGFSKTSVAEWITSELENSEDGSVFAEGRYFRWDDVAPAGYRLPLPPGRYRVGLYFSRIYVDRTGGRVFDVPVPVPESGEPAMSPRVMNSAASLESS